MQPNYTHMIFVLDRSGSMHAMLMDTIGGFNRLIEDQKKLTGECTVSLHQFDDRYETVYQTVPLDMVEPRTPHNFVPRGGTALLDAVGRAVVNEGVILTAMAESRRPSKVVLVILTDGEENSSKEFNLNKVREMLTEQQERYNWEVMFLGSSLDAISVASRMGIRAGNAASYGANMQDAMGATSKALSRGRMGQSMAYTDEERKKMGKGGTP